MKFQVNITITATNSRHVSDEDIKTALKLAKNEGVAIDVESVLRTVAASLKGKGAMACRRSKEAGNLTVSLPVKVEGKHLTKIDLSAPAKTVSKKTDEEKALELRKELGL